MAHLPRLVATLGLLILPLATLILAQQPALPLHSSSRWILDANNQRIKFRCVNWAGHQEVNIPEGLDKQPLDYITSWIQQQGFNCVRLTYSIDHALHPDVKVADAFSSAAASSGAPLTAMTGLYANMAQKNPALANATTRDVFAAVVDSLWQHNVVTILDNHVSKASWCCNLTDGNGWWDTAFGYNDANSRFFHTQEWLDGLRAMATWAAGRKGVVAMSLRNELREFLLQDLNGRADWYTYVQARARSCTRRNPDVLVVVGGVQRHY